MKVVLYLNNRLKNRLLEYCRLEKVSIKKAIKYLIDNSIALHYEEQDIMDFLSYRKE